MTNQIKIKNQWLTAVRYFKYFVTILCFILAFSSNSFAQDNFSLVELKGTYRLTIPLTGKQGDKFTVKYDIKTKVATAFISDKVLFTIKKETWGPSSDDPKYNTLRFTSLGDSYKVFDGESLAVRKTGSGYELYSPDESKTYYIMESVK